MEHNGIRQAKSVIVNRNTHSSGRTLLTGGQMRSDKEVNILRNYLLLGLALQDPIFSSHEEWFEYHDTIFPFLKLYLLLRSTEGICWNHNLK